jgi:imidazolonepropionase
VRKAGWRLPPNHYDSTGLELLIKNIRQLLQVESAPRSWVAGVDMQVLPLVENAFLYIREGLIAGFGPIEEAPGLSCRQIDASGRIVMPAFCDSHTHLVFAGSREMEFVDRIRGLGYEEIARRGGGIINSALRLRRTPEDELYRDALQRINEIISQGTGAVEIKSGYGLDLESELKMLRVIRRLKESVTVTLRSTFLGAHAVPPEFAGRQGEYADLIVNEMIPAVAKEKLADFIDVFCDRGFFTPDETARILEQAAKYGLRPKIHANELDHSCGIRTGVAYKALSVDHLEYTSEDDINLLKESGTMPTLLPGAALFLGLPWPPARRMIDAGLSVALASDFNPGSSPTGNMGLMISLACICLKMLPEEAINAATLNSAYAMGLEKELGSIAIGKKANILVTKPVPGYRYLPYAYGSNHIERVILNGLMIDD